MNKLPTLPCKIGDSVWTIVDNEVREYKVEYLDKHGTYMVAECVLQSEDCNCGEGSVCAIQFLGATMEERLIFLSPERAEAALVRGDYA